MLAMLWTSSVKPAARMCSTHCPQQPHDGLLLTTTNGSAATSWVWCVIVGISDIGADVVGAAVSGAWAQAASRSEEHTSELQSLMRIAYAVFCLKKKNKTTQTKTQTQHIKAPTK